MFRSEKCRELHAGRHGEHIDVALAVAVDAALVGEQPDAARIATAGEGREVVGFEYVDSGQHFAVPRDGPVRRSVGLVVSGDGELLLFLRGREFGGEDVGDSVRCARAQVTDSGADMRMHGVGEDDEVGLRDWIDVDGGSGEAGVSEAADR